MGKDIVFEPGRTVKNLHVKPGGLFTSGELDVEYEPVQYKFVDKAKTKIVCNACHGVGKRPGRYHGWHDDMRKCEFCDGRGSLKLKKPTKEI